MILTSLMILVTLVGMALTKVGRVDCGCERSFRAAL